jgi:hypothetical protein
MEAQRDLMVDTKSQNPELKMGYLHGDPRDDCPLCTNCTSYLSHVLGNYLGVESDTQFRVRTASGEELVYGFDDLVNIRNEELYNIFGSQQSVDQLGELLRRGDQRMQGAVGLLSFQDPSGFVLDADEIGRNTILQVWEFHVKDGKWTTERGHAVVAMEAPERTKKGTVLRSFGSNFPRHPSGRLVAKEKLAEDLELQYRPGETASETLLETYLKEKDRIFVGQVPSNLPNGDYAIIFGYNL